MPRPPKHRRIASRPGVTYFKPRGVPLCELDEVVLPLEGYEAVRLVDLEGLPQDVAADRMEVSRQTFGRILTAARRSLARVVVRGAALRIEGGHYVVRPGLEEGLVTRVAVSSTGAHLDAPVDPRFGRAACFLVIHPQTLAFEVVDHDRDRNLGHGAGLAAVERLVAAGADLVLTGRLGPQAFDALARAGIDAGQGYEKGTVREALARWREEQEADA